MVVNEGFQAGRCQTGAGVHCCAPGLLSTTLLTPCPRSPRGRGSTGPARAIHHAHVDGKGGGDPRTISSSKRAHSALPRPDSIPIAVCGEFVVTLLLACWLKEKRARR